MLAVAEAPPGFDARRAALSKRHVYLIDSRPVPTALPPPLCLARAARARPARSFLHHMIRNVVGTLVEIGRGNRPPEWMAELLLERDRTRAGPTASARGLTLLRVSHPSDRWSRTCRRPALLVL